MLLALLFCHAQTGARYTKWIDSLEYRARRLVSSRYLSVFWDERRLEIPFRRARGLIGREDRYFSFFPSHETPNRVYLVWSKSAAKLDSPYFYVSFYEYMLGVRQWRHVALCHGAFFVSRQHQNHPKENILSLYSSLILYINTAVSSKSSITKIYLIADLIFSVLFDVRKQHLYFRSTHNHARKINSFPRKGQFN